MALEILDAYPVKARFRAGEPIEIGIELAGSESNGASLRLAARLTRLDRILEERDWALDRIDGGNTRIETLSFAPRQDTYAGYGVEIELLAGGRSARQAATAFEVAAPGHGPIRYGFLCDFAPGSGRGEEDVRNLAKLHLNYAQFYDWMYRHDDLVPPGDRYTDPMGRELSLTVVKGKIERCRALGIKSLAYGAIYAASKEFFAQHRDWAYFGSSGLPLSLGGLFHIMNIAPGSPWRDHIINQFVRTVAEVGFDGIHLDTYGFPKTAWPRLPGRSRPERLDEIFPGFIAEVRAMLARITREPCLIFNCVGNWPVAAVAGAPQDAVYIEVWPPYERYRHLQEIIDRAKIHGRGKPVILAAYLSPFAEEGPAARKAAEASALYLTAAIHACGGSHLLFGGKSGVLTQGYYPQYARIDRCFQLTIRNYYDFIARYGDILFDPDLDDVTMTHAGGDNLEYAAAGVPTSLDAEPGKIWMILREKPGRKTVNLINLTGLTDDRWNKGQGEPVLQRDLEIRILLDGDLRTVYWASPDFALGRAQTPAYEVVDSPRGWVLVAKLPSLLYWNLMVVETEQ